MKKAILTLLVLVVVLAAAAFLFVAFFLDGMVKRGVETVGPRITKVETGVESVDLSMISGEGKLEGFKVGNPPGYKSPAAIQVGQVSVSVKPATIFADKVVIRSIDLQNPEITFEGGLRDNNLRQLLDNIESTSNREEKDGAAKDETAPKKLQVNDFKISGGKIHLLFTPLGGTTTTVNLPAIHLTDLGTGPEGITPAELSKRVLQVILQHALASVTSSAGELGKGATDLMKGMGTNTVSQIKTGAVETIGKGLQDLLKKK